MLKVNTYQLITFREKLVEPLRHKISMIYLKAVKLAVLDENERELTYATGFITKENGENYLYTAWHFVTGYDPHNLEVKPPQDS